MHGKDAAVSFRRCLIDLCASPHVTLAHSTIFLLGQSTNPRQPRLKALRTAPKRCAYGDIAARPLKYGYAKRFVASNMLSLAANAQKRAANVRYCSLESMV